MQQAGGDNPCSKGLTAEDVKDSTIPKVLREGDDTTDIIFTVEERNLHFSKAVLTMCSPVFRNLLTPEYIQQHSEGIPLPGKKYSTMAFFLQLIHPVYSVTPLTDDVLVDMLALAQEYQVDHIRTKCEQFIAIQLERHECKKILSVDDMLFYLIACEQHNLTTHRDKLVKFAAEKMTREIENSKFFESVPSTVLKDVFLARSQTMEVDLRSLKQKKASQLQRVKSDINYALSCLSNQTLLDLHNTLKLLLKQIGDWEQQ